MWEDEITDQHVTGLRRSSRNWSRRRRPLLLRLRLRQLPRQLLLLPNLRLPLLQLPQPPRHRQPLLRRRKRLWSFRDLLRRILSRA